MKTIFLNKKSKKTNEPHKVFLNLSQKLDLKSSNKHIALQKLSIYYTWKSIRQQYKSNKVKIIPPAWKDEFELPGGLHSVSDVQDYIENNTKNMEHYPRIILFKFTSIGLIID